MHIRTLIVAAALALTPAVLAIAAPGAPGHSHGNSPVGEPGDPKKPARLIPVGMRETDDGKMLYFPDRIEIRRGEQVKFALKNSGRVAHEFVLDTVENNAKHKIEMQKNPDMEHDDPNSRRLTPNQSGEIVWRFTRVGRFEFACLIPGHYEAGMKGVIVVK